MLPHDGQEHLVQRRLADGVKLDPEILLALLQEGEQAADAAVFAFALGVCRRMVVLDLVLPVVIIAVRVVTVGSSSIWRCCCCYRNAKPQLPMVGLLLDDRTGEGHPDPVPDPLHVFVRRVRGLRVHEMDMVHVAVLAAEILGRAEREHPLRHDARAVGERVRLLHRVRRQDERASGHDGREGAPHDALRCGVHARRGLVEEQHGRVAHQRDAEGELALVPAGQLGRHAVRVGRQPNGADDLADVVLHVGDAADAGVEAEVLFDGHLVDGVELGADAEVGARGGAVPQHRDILDEDVSAVVRGLDVAADEADGGCLACAVGAEEGEHLASADAEGDVLDGDELTECLCEVQNAEAVVGACYALQFVRYVFVDGFCCLFDVFWFGFASGSREERSTVEPEQQAEQGK